MPALAGSNMGRQDTKKVPERPNLCIQLGRNPPYPPLRKGGSVPGAPPLSPLLRRGDTGGFFECLRTAPGLWSDRVETL
jgi:hypothetical protein